jgi:hypothetical protein
MILVARPGTINHKGDNMSLTIKEVGSILVEGNKTAFKANASRRAGQMFNERVAALITPRLPMLARAYANESWFKFILANAVAGSIIKFGATNEKLVLLADAGVNAANDDFLGSFDFEGMINGVIDGIDISGLTQTAEDVREGASAGLRKAADIVEPGEVA